MLFVYDGLERQPLDALFDKRKGGSSPIVLGEKDTENGSTF